MTENLSEEHYAYLLCLYLSSVETHILNCEIDNDERKLFQLISTVAASGYFNADAIWFGFPRPERNGFHAALRAAFHERIKEGVVVETPEAGTNTDLKDGELDIIVHRKMNDELPGQLFFYGQVASGKNYKNKPLSREQINLIHYSWFKKGPSMDFLRGMFIPFCSWHEVEGSLGREALRVRISQETVRYGIVFSRYRIPFYLHEIMVQKRAASLELQVDGLNEIGLVTEWGVRFIEHMRGDRNAA